MSEPMQIWALTGPVGAGKSAASRILAERGVAIVDGDKLGHQLLADLDIQEAIGQRLGDEFLVQGVVDRRALGALVFQDEGALATLNEIMHGPLGRLATGILKDLARAGDHKLAVFEAAVYFRLPSPPTVDLVLVVNASADVRQKRLVQRGLSAEAAKKRITAQHDLKTEWTAADHTLWNEGSLDELSGQLLSLLDKYHLGSESAS